MSEKRPKGIIGQWYTLTTDFKGAEETADRMAGYTWQCKEVDDGIPLIDGVWIALEEGYRLATPEEIERAKAKQQPSYSDLIAAEYDRLKEKQLAKNKDYGDSLFQNKTILGVEINKRIGILSRIGDKIARLESQGEYMVEEGREETIDDLIGYLIAFQIVSRE